MHTKPRGPVLCACLRTKPSVLRVVPQILHAVRWPLVPAWGVIFDAENLLIHFLSRDRDLEHREGHKKRERRYGSRKAGLGEEYIREKEKVTAERKLPKASL